MSSSTANKSIGLSRTNVTKDNFELGRKLLFVDVATETVYILYF